MNHLVHKCSEFLLQGLNLRKKYLLNSTNASFCITKSKPLCTLRCWSRRLVQHPEQGTLIKRSLRDIYLAHFSTRLTLSGSAKDCWVISYKEHFSSFYLCRYQGRRQTRQVSPLYLYSLLFSLDLFLFSVFPFFITMHSGVKK